MGGAVRVACINAPARACRVSVRVTRRGRTVAFLRARVRVGTARQLGVPARGRLTVRASDPDGRWRTAYAE